MMLLGEAIGVKKLTNDCIATLYRRRLQSKQSIQTMHYNYYYLKSAMDKCWIESVGCEKRKELLISTMPWIVVLAAVCLLSRCEKQEDIGEAPYGRLKGFTTLGEHTSSCDDDEIEREEKREKQINKYFFQKEKMTNYKRLGWVSRVYPLFVCKKNINN